MSSKETSKSSGENKARPTGTSRAYFTGAVIDSPASATPAHSTGATSARPASASTTRPANASTARQTNAPTARQTNATSSQQTSTTTTRQTTRARSVGATANQINPNKTSSASSIIGPRISPDNQLRQRMAEELSMFGLAPRSQLTYLAAVDRLASRSWKSVEQLSEDEIRRYILNLRDNGAAQGTFKTNWFGLQFLYEHVLGRGWALFTKKRSGSQSKSAFLMSFLTRRCNGFCTLLKAQFTVRCLPLCTPAACASARPKNSPFRTSIVPMERCASSASATKSVTFPFPRPRWKVCGGSGKPIVTHNCYSPIRWASNQLPPASCTAHSKMPSRKQAYRILLAPTFCATAMPLGEIWGQYIHFFSRLKRLK